MYTIQNIHTGEYYTPFKDFRIDLGWKIHIPSAKGWEKYLDNVDDASECKLVECCTSEHPKNWVEIYDFISDKHVWIDLTQYPIIVDQSTHAVIVWVEMGGSQEFIYAFWQPKFNMNHLGDPSAPEYPFDDTLLNAVHEWVQERLNP